MAIETTYSKVHAAYVSLLTLVQGRIGSPTGDGDGYKPTLPLTTILRYKRIMGLLKPFAADYEELRSELFEKFAYSGSGYMSKELREELRKLADEPVPAIGSDLVSTEDFGSADKLPVAMIGFFMDLGPFLKED
jgi:hypothetical protein